MVIWCDSEHLLMEKVAMRKTLNEKIDDIKEYVITQSRQTKKHQEFLRLSDLHSKSTLNRNDLEKLKLLTGFFIGERLDKARNKKLKEIERKENKKNKLKQKRDYERSCFLHGSILTKLRNDNKHNYLLSIYILYKFLENHFNENEQLLNDLSINITKNPHIETKEELERLLSDEKNKSGDNFYSVECGVRITLYDELFNYYFFEKLVSKEYGEIKSVGKSTYRKNRLTGEKEYVAHNTVGWHTKLK